MFIAWSPSGPVGQCIDNKMVDSPLCALVPEIGRSEGVFDQPWTHLQEGSTCSNASISCVSCSLKTEYCSPQGLSLSLQDWESPLLTHGIVNAALL